jgi:transcriptional regulator with XRE-family HTH domain
MNRLAYGLRRTRLEFGLNMSEMGTILVVHVGTVSRIESGARQALRWVPETVAARIGIPAADFLGHALNATTFRRSAISVCDAVAPEEPTERCYDHDQYR